MKFVKQILPVILCYLINNYMNNIESISKNTKYLKWYLSLVSKEYSNETYSENHHILPKSLGGTNTKINIVRIPGRVHFICHKLLVRMMLDTKHKKSMVFALNMLAKANNLNQNRHQISSREYEIIRKQLAEAQSGENSNSYGKPAWNKGITHTLETREKLSKANIEHFKTHHGTRLGAKVSEETRQKQRGPKTEQAKLNMSIAAKQKPRLTCTHCSAYITTSNHTRYHGDKCKKAPKGPNAFDSN